MPELPEVETVRTALDKALSGAMIDKVTLHRADLRVPFPRQLPEQLEGRRIVSVGRRGKYLVWQLEDGQVILAHLGMTGSFAVHSKTAKTQKHDHLEMYLKDGRQVVFSDPRRFGIITLTTSDELSGHPLISHLGPDPLNKAFSTAYLKKVLSRRKAPIKAVLMDQTVVVGVGNIYASEALFLAGVHPLTPAYITANKAGELIKAIRHILRLAIVSGGSSLRDFVNISGDTGYFQHHFKVYDRAKTPCQSCKEPIQTARIAGRSSFFCPVCQH